METNQLAITELKDVRLTNGQETFLLSAVEIDEKGPVHGKDSLGCGYSRCDGGAGSCQHGTGTFILCDDCGALAIRGHRIDNGTSHDDYAYCSKCDPGDDGDSESWPIIHPADVTFWHDDEHTETLWEA